MLYLVILIFSIIGGGIVGVIFRKPKNKKNKEV